MATIDDMLTALHRVRGQLVAERRADADAAAVRANALLAKARREAPDGH